MRRIFYIGLFFAALASVTLQAQTNEKPIISVLDFKTSGISKAEVEVFVDFFCSHIIATGKYRVIDKMQREELLREMEFSYEDCTDESCQLEIGKLLAANQIIVGSIGRVGERYLLTIKLIDVETGEAVKTGSEKYSDLNQLIDDSERLATEFVGAATPQKKDKQARKTDTKSESVQPDTDTLALNTSKFKASSEQYFPLQNPAYLGFLDYDQFYVSLAASNMNENRSETILLGGDFPFEIHDEILESVARGHMGYNFPLGQRWGLGAEVFTYFHKAYVESIVGEKSPFTLFEGLGGSLSIGSRLTDTLSFGLVISLHDEIADVSRLVGGIKSGHTFRQAVAADLLYRSEPATLFFDSFLGQGTDNMIILVREMPLEEGDCFKIQSPLLFENTLIVITNRRRTVIAVNQRNEIAFERPLYVGWLTLALDQWLLPWLSLRAAAEGFYSYGKDVNNYGLGATAGATLRIPRWKLDLDLNLTYRERPFKLLPDEKWQDVIVYITISKQQAFVKR